MGCNKNTTSIITMLAPADTEQIKQLQELFNTKVGIGELEHLISNPDKMNRKTEHGIVFLSEQQGPTKPSGQ